MRATWEWVKRHWEPVVGGAVLLLGFLFGVAVSRRTTPVVGPNPVKDKAEKEAEAEIQKVEAKAADEKAEVIKDAAQAEEVFIQEVEKKTEEVRDSTDETNSYLQSVGKSVRGEDP